MKLRTSRRFQNDLIRFKVQIKSLIKEERLAPVNSDITLIIE